MVEGDWNDGMNRAGDKGLGESVWLAWFQITVVRLFAPVTERRAEFSRAEQWRNYASKLQFSVQEHGWDGDWFVCVLMMKALQ
jgi:cyclic beta-1,2-glucan synthetase